MKKAQKQDDEKARRLRLAKHLRKWSPFAYGLIAADIEIGIDRLIPSEIALSFAHGEAKR